MRTICNAMPRTVPSTVVSCTRVHPTRKTKQGLGLVIASSSRCCQLAFVQYVNTYLHGLRPFGMMLHGSKVSFAVGFSENR